MAPTAGRFGFFQPPAEDRCVGALTLSDLGLLDPSSDRRIRRTFGLGVTPGRSIFHVVEK
jgi:hypothetical protein